MVEEEVRVSTEVPAEMAPSAMVVEWLETVARAVAARPVAALVASVAKRAVLMEARTLRRRALAQHSLRHLE